MSRAARLFDLIQLLRTRKRAVSAAAVAQELGVSKRTVHRDIGTLVALGAPIEGAAGVGYLLRPGFLLPPLMFTPDELEAVALGGLWVAQRADSHLVEAARNALAKIAAVLPQPLTATIDTPASLSAPAARQIADTVDMRTIRSAIRQQRKLQIVYADEKDQKTTRTIWPIALVYFDASRLVAAWCEMRRGFRHFRSDRITGATVLTERYPQSRSTLLKAWRMEDEGSGRRAAPPQTVARN
jgi:predicted DNA-binding transcriptional regulator YafY